MNIAKRVIDLSTQDLQNLQEAILAEIRRRNDIAPPPAETVEHPGEIAPPTPVPSRTEPGHKPHAPRRAA